MKRNDLFGYLLGLAVFVVVIPLIMWRVAGKPTPGLTGLICLVVFAVVGIGLSIWSIVYMRIVGKGNPMDAFNHEIAPRTSVLMTEGPYRLCRNPMLLGVFLYYIGLLICLRSWKAVVVFAVYVVIMMIQVNSEEKRLERDFGEEYLAYKARTGKIIPFLR